jgi:outer membrane protein, heavy metal efflux system
LIFSLPSTQLARLTVIGIALAAAQAIAQGQTATAAISAPSLRQALGAAWALSPQARAADNRRGELQARQNAAGGWFAGEAVATLAHRTDRLNANGGLREYEAEVELPLWSPRVRSATQRQIAADTAGFELQQTLARLKLAGQLRELAASLATARAEQTVAQRKVTEANALLLDVQRRVKAGDTARVDALQAQVAVQTATSAVATADSSLARQQAQWRALTGLSAVATLEAEAAAPIQTTGNSLHPLLQATQAQVQAAQAKLALTQADQRDPMALGIGITRERGAFEDVGQTSLRLALKIPLGGDNRNLPRLAAARAELDTAQAEAEAAERQVGADVAAAQADLAAARAAQTVATERVRLTREVQSLVAKSYQLGQADLPTRLRADNDSLDADLSEARARTDVQRAISQLNQALGLLP